MHDYRIVDKLGHSNIPHGFCRMYLKAEMNFRTPNGGEFRRIRTLLADRHHRSLLGGAKTYQLTGEKTSNTRPPRVRFRAPIATELLGGVATAFFVRVS